MTARVVITPPQELFRELAEMGNLVLSMLAGPQVTVRRWPAYYMVYLKLDQLCRELSRATAALSRGFIAPDGRVDTLRIEAANAGLAGSKNTCVAWSDCLRISGVTRLSITVLPR